MRLGDGCELPARTRGRDGPGRARGSDGAGPTAPECVLAPRAARGVWRAAAAGGSGSADAGRGCGGGAGAATNPQAPPRTGEPGVRPTRQPHGRGRTGWPATWAYPAAPSTARRAGTDIRLGSRRTRNRPCLDRREVWTSGWTADRDPASSAHVYRRSRNLGSQVLDDVQRAEAQRMGFNSSPLEVP